MFLDVLVTRGRINNDVTFAYALACVRYDAAVFFPFDAIDDAYAPCDQVAFVLAQILATHDYLFARV